jgi:hypothetical protein
MRKPTIGDLWLSYLDQVIPVGAPLVQIQESKRAFYAAAGLVLDLLMSGIGDDTVSEEDGVAYLESLHQEVRAFVGDVVNGRA